MGAIHEVATALGKAGRNLRAGSEKLTFRKLGLSEPPTLEVTSTDFTPGQSLPTDGSAPPHLRWSRVPDATRSIAVVCEDPDAPLPEPFVHWLVYGIPSVMPSLDATSARSAYQGRNSTLTTGFTRPTPVPGHGVHHYHFQVFALDADVELRPRAGRGELLKAIRGHVLAWGDLVGTSERL